MDYTPIKATRLTIAPPMHFSGYFDDIRAIYRAPDFHRYMMTPKSPLPDDEDIDGHLQDITATWKKENRGLMMARQDELKRFVVLLGVQPLPDDTPEIVCGVHP